MEIAIESVRDLRERTGAGVLDAKKALESAGGDMDQAIQILREKGLATAAKKSSREANDGVVTSYIHGDPGRVGVLLELNCETDFVARTDRFQTLAREIALQIASMSPEWASVDDIPPDVLEHERATLMAAATQDGQNAGKPPEILEKIIAGKVDKWLDEVVLIRQRFVKDNSRSIGDLITEAIAEIGENIVLRRFARFELGERV